MVSIMQTTPLISALANPRAYAHPVDSVDVIETHISWVLLAGNYAYKIKKPVKLAFVDFSDLAARRAFCEDELRLNRRLAPQVYLEVATITGTPDAPRIGGDGPALEYAVCMRRFDQNDMFSELARRDALEPGLIDALATRIADFHARAEVVTSDSTLGAPEAVLQPALDNFCEMAEHAGPERATQLDALEDWTRAAYARLEPLLAARQRDGFVRDCHGDLHLGNIARINGEAVPFDCLEFSTELRSIDVINEVAFLVMDLMDRGRAELGFRFLDRYLQITGDYPGIRLLRFYIVYRALVRAKIHDLRARQAADQDDSDEAARLQSAADHYLALARDTAEGARPALLLMHGFSASGKSSVAAGLVERLGAIRLRSDVERKRLFGLDAREDSQAEPGAGIYDHNAGARTYAHLAERARELLAAGYPTVIDAAFLDRAQRQPMQALAADLGVPLRIVNCSAPADTLRARLQARAAKGRDPSDATQAVLERQLKSQEPFTADEMPAVVNCPMDGDKDDNTRTCAERVAALLESGVS
jgi:hypothetical protein